jgi:hypothetical protein
MSSIEYYYPLATLNLKTDSIGNKKYFDVSINALEKPKTNFAIKGVVSGTATQYYIQPIDKESDKTKFDMANNYLVIKHAVANPVTNFYVAIPLYIARDKEDISKYVKNDRMNGRLAQSFDNLNKAKTSVQFSLESVIDSMKSFAPTAYYELTDKTINKKIYVLNKPIYVKNINTASFYKGDVTIPEIIVNPTKATINRVKVTRTCLKPNASKKKACESMFYGLGKKEQVKIDYLNLIYGLVALILTIVFYHINGKYIDNFDKRQTAIYGLLAALAIVVIPIGSTKGAYEGKTEKIIVSSLKESIIFARYFILFILSSITMIFGLTNIKDFFTSNFNYDAMRLLMKNAFTSPWTKEKWTNLIIFIGSLFLISTSIYIFTPSPNECLL